MSLKVGTPHSPRLAESGAVDNFINTPSVFYKKAPCGTKAWRFFVTEVKWLIYKRCDKCGKRMSPGVKCSCKSARRYKEKQTDDYYLTEEWRIARDICIKQCFGLDIFALYYQHEIAYGFTVHHIYPLKDYFSLRKTQKNLIYLTEQNHRLVHRMLKENFIATVEMLENFKTLFYEEFLKSGGDYKNVLFELPQTAPLVHLL